VLADHLGVQQHPFPFPPGRERHRLQETLDLAGPQVRESCLALAPRGAGALAGQETCPVRRAQDPVQWSGVQGVQRGEHLADLRGYPVLVPLRHDGPGRGQVGAREPRHEHVTPAVLVLAAGQQLRRGDGQPAG
jgi:hypothetical protein